MERHKNVLNKKFLQLRMIFVSLFAKVCLGKANRENAIVSLHSSIFPINFYLSVFSGYWKRHSREWNCYSISLVKSFHRKRMLTSLYAANFQYATPVCPWLTQRSLKIGNISPINFGQFFWQIAFYKG